MRSALAQDKLFQAWCDQFVGDAIKNLEVMAIARQAFDAGFTCLRTDENVLECLQPVLGSERDLYEVANQLGGYVGPNTEKRLASFLIRESEEASLLADEIVKLRERIRILERE